MKIIISLDPIDRDDPLAVDPVGTISLISGTRVLREPAAYIDSWLLAIQEGAELLRSGDEARIDLVEEPDPLILQRKNDAIRITFRDQFIVADSVEEIESALRDASQYLSSNQIFPKLST